MTLKLSLFDRLSTRNRRPSWIPLSGAAHLELEDEVGHQGPGQGHQESPVKPSWGQQDIISVNWEGRFLGHEL
jgi:hypothetical protein